MSGGGLLNKGLPYDAEIEYLRSSGGQFIDTGVILQRADLCRMDIVFTSYQSNAWNTNGLSGTIYGGPAVGNNSLKISYAAGTRDISTSVEVLLDVPYRYNLDIKNSTYIVEDYLNGTEVYHDNNITKSQYNPGRVYSMLIFGYRSNGGIPTARQMAIYKAAIYENDVLLRDFIPVRIGNVGYMYDKVSKQLFGNAGTGDFILGPDK